MPWSQSELSGRIAACALAVSCACTVKHRSPDVLARSAGPVAADGGQLAEAPGDPGPPAVFEIEVDETGFHPARVAVRARQTVVLRLTRTAKETCADAIDVQGDPVRHPLPLGQLVEVRFSAPPSGQVNFACPMNLRRGAAVVVR
jgi:hypothetical protein